MTLSAKMGKLLMAALLLGMAIGAQAKDYDLGSLMNGYNNFGPYSVSGTFQDKVFFNIDNASNGSFGGGPLNFSIQGQPYLNISNMSISLLNDANTLMGSGLDFSVNNLDSGTYYLKVTGDADGIAGGLYAGAINITALPVPEPGTWSSLLAGLMMVGWIMARRRDI